MKDSQYGCRALTEGESIRDEAREGGTGLKIESLAYFIQYAKKGHSVVIMGKGRQVKLALWKDRPCSRMEPRCPGARLEAGTVDG